MVVLRSFRPFLLHQRTKRSFFRLLRRLPIIGVKIQEEFEKTRKNLEESLRPKCNLPYVTRIPERGLNKKEVLERYDRRYCCVVVVPDVVVHNYHTFHAFDLSESLNTSGCAKYVGRKVALPAPSTERLLCRI